ncbi:MAG: hypothetical protein ACTSQY_08335 [Candidatus Odinarchaeia archaeon]
MAQVKEEKPISFEEFKKKRGEWYEKILFVGPMSKKTIAGKLIKARFSKNPYLKAFKSLYSDPDEVVYRKYLEDPYYRRICEEELGL